MDAGIEVPRGEIVNTETVSLKKKIHTKKKEEMETRAPVRKVRWKQQPLGKKMHKNRQQVMLVAITSG